MGRGSRLGGRGEGGLPLPVTRTRAEHDLLYHLLTTGSLTNQ